MSFINPAFLWALSAIIIPIIIHLINLRKHKVVYFSNTIFLENIKKDSRKHTQLKHLLILLARILTITMLVIAFAGPYIPNPNAHNNKPSEISIIYIDNSFSMQNEGTKGQLLKQAVQIAKEIVINSEPEKDFILITNSMKPEHQFILNHDNILREIDKIDFDPKPLIIRDLVVKAGSLTPTDKKAILYVISDMQESFISQDEAHEKLPDNIDLIFVPLAVNKIANLYVDSCFFLSPIHKLGQEEELSIILKNSSENDFYEIPIKLYINDTLKAMSTFDIEAKGNKEIKLKYKNTTKSHIKGRIEISDYPVTYDNELFFNYYAAEQTRILNIFQNNDNKYLNAVFNDSEAGFICKTVKAGNEQSSEILTYDLVVLNGLNDISSGLASILKEFIALGGSVLIFPPTELNENSYNTFLNQFNAGQFQNQRVLNSRIEKIEANHYFLKNIFLKIEKNTDLPSVGMSLKYNLFSTSTSSVLYLSAGNNPIFSFTKYGQGQLFIFSSPIVDINSDFLKSPLFAPTIYNIVIKSQINPDLYGIIQNNYEYELKGITEIEPKDIFRITDNKSIDIVCTHRSYGKSVKLFIPDEIKKAATYQIFNHKTFLNYISLNYDRRESVLKYVEKEDLQNFIRDKLNNKALIISDAENLKSSLVEISEGKRIWQYFILMALFFIISEITIARLM
ncbi:MAG: BatA domain-containing protein [Bacteroidales bacterium]|jgi:hypothetical protein